MNAYSRTYTAKINAFIIHTAKLLGGHKLILKSFRPVGLTLALLATQAISAYGCTKKSDIRYDLDQPGIVAQVGDQQIDTTVFAKIWQIIRTNKLYRQFGDTPEKALFAVIENLLVAERYKAESGNLHTNEHHSEHYSEQHASGHGSHDHGWEIENRIDRLFLRTVDYYLDDKTLREKYSRAEAKLIAPTPEQVKDLFVIETDDNSVAVKTALPISLAKAQALEVLPKNPLTGPASFAAFFKTLNENEQASLAGGGNKDHLQFLLKRFARQQFLKKYIRTDSGRTSQYTQIRKIVAAGIYAGEYRNSLGVQTKHVHADDPQHIQERAENISMSRVREYYEKHIDRFTEIKSARCLHITVANSQKAAAIGAQAKQASSAEFKKLIVKHSIAEDKNAPEPGMVSGVVNGPDLHTKPRLHTLCLMTPPNKTEVFPNGDTYEIVRSLKKDMGYTPLDDTSTIIPQIRKELALEDIRQEYSQLQKDLYKGITIRINRGELGRI